MKFRELQALCRKRELTVKGNKGILVARLRQYDREKSKEDTCDSDRAADSDKENSEDAPSKPDRQRAALNSITGYFGQPAKPAKPTPAKPPRKRQRTGKAASEVSSNELNPTRRNMTHR
jgi:hypothetical protein